MFDQVKFTHTQYNAIQYNTIQHNTTQHSKTQRILNDVDVLWLPRLPSSFFFFPCYWWICLCFSPIFLCITRLCVCSVFFIALRILFLISCMIHTYYFILSVALMLKSTKIYNPTFAVIKSSNVVCLFFFFLSFSFSLYYFSLSNRAFY